MGRIISGAVVWIFSQEICILVKKDLPHAASSWAAKFCERSKGHVVRR
jgi:hypothetical protein